MGRKGMIAKPTNAARGKVCKQACILRMDESGDGIKLSTNIHVAHLGNEPKLLRYLVFQRCRDGLVTADLSSARAGLCETLIEHDKATLVGDGVNHSSLLDPAPRPINVGARCRPRPERIDRTTWVGGAVLRQTASPLRPGHFGLPERTSE
jgi:hypothetical protein